MDTLAILSTALAAQYAFEGEIGRGGMAVVYLARDLKHGRRVAVKVLNPELAAIIGPERFLSEIRITANLQHPNLLPLFDSGEVNGMLYYVMPYVEGESLRARLTRERQLPVAEAVHIAAVVAAALDHAHRHDVIHRDLKPENILLHDGEPLIADFGIALAVSNAGGNRITQTGLSLGTPQYMSPEQATGERTIDRRTDIFALGAVLYEMLAGEPPHAGVTAQAVIAKILSEPARPVRATRQAVPANVDAAITRALAKIPADRWSTAQAFAAALNDNASVASVASGGEYGTSSWSARLRTAAPFALATLLLGALGAAAALRPNSAPTDDSYAFVVTLPDSAAVSTGTAGLGGDVSISRDGKTIAYLAGPAAGGDIQRGIWTRALNELAAVPVRGLENGSAPRFSPDGKFLMYEHDNWLCVIPVAGGVELRVVQNASSYDWIDSESIVYTAGLEMWAGSRRGSELWTTTIHNPKPRLVTVGDSARRIVGVGFPSALPGGTAALATIWKGQLGNARRELAVVSLKDGAITELGLAGSTPRYAVGRLLFAKDDGGLYAVPFSPSKQRVEGTAVQIAPQIVVKLTGWADFDVSDNGTVTYVGGSEARRRLMLVERSGVATPVSPEIRRFYFPRVSPDGRTIAVEVGTTEGGFDIWTYDRESRTLGALTTDHRSMRPGGWTDGGSSLAYIGVAGKTGYWTASIRTLSDSAPRRDVLATSIHTTDVVLGGRLIALRRDGGQIDVGPIDGSAAARQIVPASASAGTIGLSRDGRYLIYESNAGGTTEIYGQSVLGDEPRVQLSSGGGTEPMWSPRNDEIFYRGASHLIAVKVTLNPLRVVRRDSLFRDTYMRGAVSANYAPMPNAQQFIMVENEHPDVYPTVLVNRLRRVP